MQGKQHDSQLLYALSSSCIINLVSEFVKGIMSWEKNTRYKKVPLSYLNILFYLPSILIEKLVHTVEGLYCKRPLVRGKDTFAGWIGGGGQ